MQYKITKEGSAIVYTPKEEKISADLPVFYNPAMKLNRDVTILLLNSIKNKNMKLADPLAATGVRSIRMIKELSKSKIKSTHINDINREAFNLIKENLKLNKISANNKNNVIVENADANYFLEKNKLFDYIDIDPFGPPMHFLDSSIKSLKNNGILAVTATDTGALSGSFEKACIRKYLSKPLKTELMHETGLRILIRRAQLTGIQNKKALFPAFSYSKQHYMRAFLVYKDDNIRNVQKSHGFLIYCRKCLHHELIKNISKKQKCRNCRNKPEFAGPLWTGNLFDKSLVNKMQINSDKNNKELNRFISIIKDESKMDAFGFYNLHKIAHMYKLKEIPRKEKIINKIISLGYKASGTHFAGEAIKSDIAFKRLLKLMKIDLNTS